MRRQVTTLAERLLERLDREFTRIVVPPGAMRDTAADNIHGLRCRDEPAGFPGFLLGERVRRCNFSPTVYDRDTARVLLQAWIRRDISDRYLDFVSVRYMNVRESDRPTSENDAFEEMRQPYPVGAVQFVYNQLRRGGQRGDLPLHGEAMTESTTYNEVYSALLVWDDQHVMGIIPWLNEIEARFGAEDGMEAAIPVFARAAKRWIAHAQRTPGTIYHRLSEHGS